MMAEEIEESERKSRDENFKRLNAVRKWTLLTIASLSTPVARREKHVLGHLVVKISTTS